MSNISNWIDRVQITPMGMSGYVVHVGKRTIARVYRKITAELIVNQLRDEFHARNGGAA